MVHTTPGGPVTLVIVGATGDLAQKKLFPSLFNLYKKGLLPANSSIIAFSRRPWTDRDFHALVRASFPQKKAGERLFDSFLKLVSYHEGYFEDQKAFERLVTRLEEIDVKLTTYADKYVYLAVSPDSYKEIIIRLGKAVLDSKAKLGVKLLIEKPFGKSLATARNLEKTISQYFKEKDVLLVDHYLGKTALHGMMALFETMPDYFSKVWSNKHVVRVEAKLFEHRGIDGRTEFYDSVGALLDVGQNHVLEMLASVVASAHGQKGDAQKHRQAFLESLTVNPDLLVRGQYSDYADEVRTKSSTETYFKVGLKSSDARWKGVDFSMEAGKAMPQSIVDVQVHMKDGETFVIRIQPKPFLVIPSSAGRKDQKIIVDEVFDAYEHVFLAAFARDPGQFPSLGEIYASWKLIDKVRPVLSKTPLRLYQKGSVPIS